MRRARLVLLVFAAVGSSVGARPVRASEGESALSVAAEYSVVTVGAEGAEASVTARGGGVAVMYERGIGDVLWLRGSLGGGAHDGPDGAAYSSVASVGLTYTFDVLRYVPYVTLSAGGLVVGGGGLETTIDPIVGLGAGLDVLSSRSSSWGLYVGFEGFASDALRFHAGVRRSWRWGFF